MRSCRQDRSVAGTRGVWYGLIYDFDVGYDEIVTAFCCKGCSVGDELGEFECVGNEDRPVYVFVILSVIDKSPTIDLTLFSEGGYIRMVPGGSR